MVWLAYLAAGLVAVAAGLGAESSGWHPIAVALAADVAATVVIFVASFLFKNSSFYDPYWSVAPRRSRSISCCARYRRPSTACAFPRLRARARLGGPAHLELGARLAGARPRGLALSPPAAAGRGRLLAGELRRHPPDADVLGLRRLPALVSGAGRGDAASRRARRGRRAGDGRLDLDREARRRPAAPLPRGRPRPAGDPEDRAVGLVAPPELFWRDGLLVGPLAVRAGGKPRRGGGRSWAPSRSR